MTFALDFNTPYIISATNNALEKLYGIIQKLFGVVGVIAFMPVFFVVLAIINTAFFVFLIIEKIKLNRLFSKRYNTNEEYHKKITSEIPQIKELIEQLRKHRILLGGVIKFAEFHIEIDRQLTIQKENQLQLQESFNEAFNELKLIREGKKESTPANQFITELRNELSN